MKLHSIGNRIPSEIAFHRGVKFEVCSLEFEGNGILSRDGVWELHSIALIGAGELDSIGVRFGGLDLCWRLGQGLFLPTHNLRRVCYERLDRA